MFKIKREKVWKMLQKFREWEWKEYKKIKCRKIGKSDGDD